MLKITQCSYCKTITKITTIEQPEPVISHGICPQCNAEQLKIMRVQMRIEKGEFDTDAVYTATADAILTEIKQSALIA